jgi:hypothetical protein
MTHNHAHNHAHCNELERLLNSGFTRQARRRFERLFPKYYATLEPDPLQHPRLAIVLEDYKKRLDYVNGLRKTPQ